MKMKLVIELENPKSCGECPLFIWDDHVDEYRCAQHSDIYYSYKTGEYVNRDKCPLVPDTCCGGGCCKK